MEKQDNNTQADRPAARVTRPASAKRGPRPECPPLRAERMRKALSTKDPEWADWLERHFCGQHLGADFRHAEPYLEATRHKGYARLTPLRATDLFADEYREAWEWRTRKTDDHAQCELSGDYPDATTPVMKDLWRARQQADALGMDYPDYIHWVFEGHESRGLTLPRPRDLHGASALAIVLAARATQEVVDAELDGFLADLK